MEARKGRPKGAKNVETDQAVAIATRCPSCSSTERTPYTDKRVLEHAGTAPDGQPYTRVTWRRTQCQACGQHRIDKLYENVPAAGGKK